MTRLLNRLLHNEYVQASLVLAGLLLFFLSWPLLNFRDSAYSASGLLQNYTLPRVQANYPAVNPVLGDTVFVIQPWLMFDRDSLASGQLPLWNPYNANGMPHLANYQSSIFSLFTLPFYVLDFKAALVVAPFIALFAHGFFAFAFLKQLKLRSWAALTGAVAYLFSGYHVLWLGWLPLVGSGVALPAGLFFVEWIFSRLQPRAATQTVRVLWPLVGLAVSLLVGLLAGHPETFFAGLFMVALYIAFRLIGFCKAGGFSRQALAYAGRLAGKFALAGVLAAGVAAIQLIPFFEYLRNSAAGAGPTYKSTVHLPPDILPLSFFPNLLGNPSSDYWATLGVPVGNYMESNSLYLGSFILFMALLSIFLVQRRGTVRFFAVVSGVWLVYIFDVLGTRGIFTLIPGVSILLPTRTYDIWLFGVSCCAASFIDEALAHAPAATDTRRRWVRPVMILVLALAFISIGLALSHALVLRFADVLLKDAAGFLAFVPPHVLTMCVTFGAGVLAVVILYFAENRWQRVLASGVLLLVVFWQSGYLFKTYNPITKDSLFYPVTPAIHTIQQTVGNATAIILGEDTLPPDSNMVYKLRLLPGYDGMWVRYHRKLYHDQFAVTRGALNHTRKASPLSLKLFGVEYVITLKPWLDIDTASFEPVVVDDRFTLYRYTGSLSRYYTVGAARLARTEDEAWAMIHAPGFDPGQVVILNGSEAQAPVGLASSPDDTAAPRPEVLSDEATSVKLRVTRNTPGYLVLALTYFPGWKARVNGLSRPVLRANYAFSAIQIDSGESVIEYYYEPDSLKYGAAVSALSLAGGAALISIESIRRRSLQRPQP